MKCIYQQLGNIDEADIAQKNETSDLVDVLCTLRNVINNSVSHEFLQEA